MSKKPLLVQSSYLATQAELQDRDIACGKAGSKTLPESFLFYLLELTSPLDDSKIIQKIIQILKSEVRSRENLSVNDFETILQQINDTLGKCASEGDNAWIGNFNALVGLIDHNEIAISQSGNIAGYIFRKNKISTITERLVRESGHPIKTFSDVTTGELMENDQIIFGNEDLFNHISLDRLRTLTQFGDVKKEAFELSHYLGKAKSISSNAIFLGASPLEEVFDEEELPDTFYLDQYSDGVKLFWEKHLLPSLKKTSNIAIDLSKRFWQVSKKTASRTSSEWKKNYGPKTKHFLQTSRESIANGIKEAKIKQKKSVIIEDTPRLNGFKIKAVPYKRFENSQGGLPAISLVGLKNSLSNMRFIIEKRNRKYLYALVIVVILVFTYFKISGNNDKKTEKKQEVEVLTAYDKALELFNETKDDLSLNKTTSLDQIYQALTFAQQAQNAEVNRDKAIALEHEIQLVIDDKIKAVRFYNAANYQLSDNIKDIALAGSEIYGINNDGKIYVVDTRDRESKLVGSIGAGFGSPINLYYSDGLKQLLILTDQKKILAFDLTSKVAGELKTENENQEWEEGTSLVTYSTNIYLLDSEAGEVWKHTKKNATYSKGNAYLDTRKVSVRGAVDLAIDGNIFVLQNDGKVAKFVKGAWEQDFALKNTPAPDDSILVPGKIYTSEDTNNLFVLDKKLHRIIKFDKSGDYVNQYFFDKTEIEDFVVNTKLQKIWGISGGKIFEGDL